MSAAEAMASQLHEGAARVSEGVPAGLVVASLFLSETVSGLYGGIGRALPDAFPLLNSLCVAMSVTAWFRVYSRRRRIPWVVDMGWFLLAGWIIVVPYYVLKLEGRRGAGRIGLFCLTYLAAWASGMAIRIWLRVFAA